MAVRQRLVAGRYRLREPVGAGGMGRVWLARDEMLHRDVAIKEIVPPEWMTEDEQVRLRQRTLREARSAARLNHPNVVRIYDVVYADGLSWIVMEYVQSRSLQEVLLEDGPYDPAVAARIGLAVLDALAAAHRAGVLHRDVKPHNVLIGTDGRVVLTDFGLATFVDDGTVTAPGLIVGSPQYVSPERGLDGASTVESDLWSLGATLYAAVEGHSPYARETAMATLAALATEPPDPPVRAGPLAPILGGLLQYEPADRLTAPEVERRLRRIVVADPREIPLLPTQRTRRRPPTAASRPPFTEPRPVATGERPPSTEDRPAPVDSRPPATASPPPATGSRPPETGSSPPHQGGPLKGSGPASEPGQRSKSRKPGTPVPPRSPTARGTVAESVVRATAAEAAARGAAVRAAAGEATVGAVEGLAAEATAGCTVADAGTRGAAVEESTDGSSTANPASPEHTRVWSSPESTHGGPGSEAAQPVDSPAAGSGPVTPPKPRTAVPAGPSASRSLPSPRIPPVSSPLVPIAPVPFIPDPVGPLKEVAVTGNPGPEIAAAGDPGPEIAVAGDPGSEIAATEDDGPEILAPEDRWPESTAPPGRPPEATAPGDQRMRGAATEGLRSEAAETEEQPTENGAAAVSAEPSWSGEPELEVIRPFQSAGQDLVLARPEIGPVISGRIVSPSLLSRLGQMRIRGTQARLIATGLVALLLGGSLLAGYVTESNESSPQVFLPAPSSTSASLRVTASESTGSIVPGPGDPVGAPGTTSPRPGEPQPPVGLPGMPTETDPAASSGAVPSEEESSKAGPSASGAEPSGERSAGGTASGATPTGTTMPGSRSPETAEPGTSPPDAPLRTASPGAPTTGTEPLGPSGMSTGSPGPPVTASTPASPSEKSTSRAVYSPVRCDTTPPAGLPRTPQRGAARGVTGLSLPSGWSYFDDGLGFHIAVPDGWTYQRIGGTYCFRSPRVARVLSLATGGDPAADPLAASQTEERRVSRSGNPRGYALIGIGSVPLLNKAADWEFRYRSRAGAPRRAVVRWFVTNGRAYTLGWSTPVANWKSDLVKIQMIRGTFYTERTTSNP